MTIYDFPISDFIDWSRRASPNKGETRLEGSPGHDESRRKFEPMKYVHEGRRQSLTLTTVDSFLAPTAP